MDNHQQMALDVLRCKRHCIHKKKRPLVIFFSLLILKLKLNLANLDAFHRKLLAEIAAF